MRSIKYLLPVFLWIGQPAPVIAQTTDWVNLVNPLIGTDSRYELSNGNTYPSVSLPWAMNSWTPQTNKMGNGWCYQYSAHKLRGFKQTHQPSPWINDYGAFSLFPTTDTLVFDEEARASWFSHKAEISKPHYYKAYLADYNTTVEITPTDRCAMFRFGYPETDKAYLIVDAFFKNSYVKVFPKERKVVGYARNARGGVPDNFHNYFVMTFDQDFTAVYGVDEGKITAGKQEVKSVHAGLILQFSARAGRAVQVKVASSFISTEQAALNLKQELGDLTFEQVKAKAADHWNSLLGRVAVADGSDAERTTFYTALYRTMLFPRKFYEFDATGKMVHYSPYNGRVEAGYMFTDNGFWDTFRAVFPLFTLLFPELDRQILEGLANTYKESGWLPEWASPGHRNCMIGSNSAPIIADAYLKGIRPASMDILYEAVLKNAENAGPLTSVGRAGVEEYNALGYIPYDSGLPENTARTLEYAYADFTLWKLAQALGRPQAEIDTFAKRAGYYRNVFDPSVNFMRGKNRDQSFQSPFRPDKWGDAFTEGCSWHWTWCVLHDPAGLAQLMGGDQAFVDKLDAVFTAAPTFDYSYYKVQIHEITEMLIMQMGQYAHGNQPIQHMVYLYNYAGAGWKTQQHVRNIMQKLYTAAPDGLCGDEDNGQTSAWYVFSALGMYPVAPGTGQYVLGSPLFKKVTLQFENGSQLLIEAPENAADKPYVQAVTLNDQPYTRTYLTHADLHNGGKLCFTMSDIPDKKRGLAPEDRPYSMSTDK